MHKKRFHGIQSPIPLTPKDDLVPYLTLKENLSLNDNLFLCPIWHCPLLLVLAVRLITEGRKCPCPKTWMEHFPALFPEETLGRLFSLSLSHPFPCFSSSPNPRPDLVLEGCWRDIREAPAAAALAAWPARAGGAPWLAVPIASCASWPAASRAAQSGISWPNW